MNFISIALRSGAPALLLCLAACSGDRVAGLDWLGSRTEPEPPPRAAPNLAGRWLLSSAGRGQCRMTFGAAPNAAEGTIAPEGGCPGKFYMSRKWTSDANGITMRDHNGQPLAQLAGDGAQFSGTTPSGEPVTLTR
jgi:hypothetical protein